MFVALDKLHRQGVKQAIVVVPEKSIGASFSNTSLKEHGFFEDWTIEPQWNLCNAAGTESGKVEALGKFLKAHDSGNGDHALVCTHATFRFAFEKFGAEAFDDRLIAVDEFHHICVSEDNRLGEFVRQLIQRDKVHLMAKAMTEERLRQVQSAIAGRRAQLTPDEALDLARRAVKFKNERGRLPQINSQDAWERRMAEGIAFLQRMKQENASG